MCDDDDDTDSPTRPAAADAEPRDGTGLAGPPATDASVAAASRQLERRVLDELERAGSPLTVGELTDRLLKRDDVGIGDAIDSRGRLHQFLYRDELQRLGSDGTLVFDTNRGLVALRPSGIATDDARGSAAATDEGGPSGDRGDGGGRARGSVTAGAAAGGTEPAVGTATRIGRWPLYYGGFAAVSVGLLWLNGVETGPLSSLHTTAVLAVVTLGYAALALAQMYLSSRSGRSGRVRA
jgi:hypothetical protein